MVEKIEEEYAVGVVWDAVPPNKKAAKGTPEAKGQPVVHAYDPSFSSFLGRMSDKITGYDNKISMMDRLLVAAKRQMSRDWKAHLEEMAGDRAEYTKYDWENNWKENRPLLSEKDKVIMEKEMKEAWRIREQDRKDYGTRNPEEVGMTAAYLAPVNKNKWEEDFKKAWIEENSTVKKERERRWQRKEKRYEKKGHPIPDKDDWEKIWNRTRNMSQEDERADKWRMERAWIRHLEKENDITKAGKIGWEKNWKGELPLIIKQDTDKANDRGTYAALASTQDMGPGKRPLLVAKVAFIPDPPETMWQKFRNNFTNWVPDADNVAIIDETLRDKIFEGLRKMPLPERKEGWAEDGVGYGLSIEVEIKSPAPAPAKKPAVPKVKSKTKPEPEPAVFPKEKPGVDEASRTTTAGSDDETSPTISTATARRAQFVQMAKNVTLTGDHKKFAKILADFSEKAEAEGRKNVVTLHEDNGHYTIRIHGVEITNKLMQKISNKIDNDAHQGRDRNGSYLEVKVGGNDGKTAATFKEALELRKAARRNAGTPVPSGRG